MIFEQVIVDESIIFFKKRFIEKWDLKEYCDKDKPLIFFGFWTFGNVYENHNSYKLIIPSVPQDLPDFRNLKNNKKTILLIDREKYPDYYIPDDVIVKNIVIEIEDNSIFKPTVLGDKIYYYSGFKNGWSGHWGEEVISEIQRNIDYEIITTSHLNKCDMYDIDFLKENFYDKSFLNLNLSVQNGMSTVRQMSLMGRKTITMRDKEWYNYRSLINCDSIENVIETIKIESKKIGTIQAPINPYNVGGEWLDLNYWFPKL